MRIARLFTASADETGGRKGKPYAKVHLIVRWLFSQRIQDVECSALDEMMAGRHQPDKRLRPLLPPTRISKENQGIRDRVDYRPETVDDSPVIISVPLALRWEQFVESRESGRTWPRRLMSKISRPYGGLFTEEEKQRKYYSLQAVDVVLVLHWEYTSRKQSWH